MYTFGVITASDKGSRNERIDESGKVIIKMLEDYGYKNTAYDVVPDELDVLKDTMIKYSDEYGVHLIITTGGTGFSLRDVTPEATEEVITRKVPGISEYIRMKSCEITKRAMLSRGVSGIRNNTLIINLPGSPKACKESLRFIIDQLDHGLKILNADASECART